MGVAAVVSTIASVASAASAVKSLTSKPKTPATQQIAAPTEATDPAKAEEQVQTEAREASRRALLSASGRSGRQSTLLSTQETGTNRLLGG